MSINDLRIAFAHPNVRAFYMVVRRGESSLDDSAYTLINGGSHFTNFAQHPFDGLLTTQGGRAAGAAQFIPSTWGELQRKYGFPDFSPPYQDLGYVGCLVKRHALDDVIAGNFDVAVQKCELEWTSLPGAAENHREWNLEKARALYLQYGGTFGIATQPAAPIEDNSFTLPESEHKPMGVLALLNLLGPIVGQLLPVVGGFLNSDKAKTNLDKVGTIFNTVTTSLGAPNLQAAIEKMQDPVAGKKAIAEAHTAIVTNPEISQFLEVGGGFAAAREADQKMQVMANQPDALPFYKTSAVFYVSLMLIPMVLWYVGSSIVGGVAIPESWPWYAQIPLKMFGKGWDDGARVGLANLVVGMILGGICGVYFGISVTQAKQQQQPQSGGGGQ